MESSKFKTEMAFEIQALMDKLRASESLNARYVKTRTKS